MPIALIASGYPGAAANTNTVSMSCTISGTAGTNRMLFVPCQSRGNAGQANITSVVLKNGGTTVATLTPVLTVDADNILHTRYYVLLEANFPANGTYTLVITANESAPGAFQTAGSWALFSACSQSYTPLTASNVNAGGYNISTNLTIPSAGLILTTWTGEGVAPPWTLTGNNTAYIESVSYLSAIQNAAGYWFAPAAATYPFTWQGQFLNRNATGVLFWAASVTPPTPSIDENAVLIGANW